MKNIYEILKQLTAENLRIMKELYELNQNLEVVEKLQEKHDETLRAYGSIIKKLVERHG